MVRNNAYYLNFSVYLENNKILRVEKRERDGLSA